MGNGTTDESRVPQKIMDGVKSVILGNNHSAAIKEDGSLWMWGGNRYGQLGIGDIGKQDFAQFVMEDVVSVGLGSRVTYALKEDGTIWHWGDDYIAEEDYVIPIYYPVLFMSAEEVYGDAAAGPFKDKAPMYRLYNPNSGEHFYTGSIKERQTLVSVGWNYEGVAFNAPREGTPVYRLFNPNSSDHHYTLSQEEVDMLVNVGWQYEGVCWNTATSEHVLQYRLYNPNAWCGIHHYTSSDEEKDYLISLGWIYEGIGWYGLK